METERLIIDEIREMDKEDYFQNISHDKRVLETFICRYAETVKEFDFTPILANKALFAIRLKETGKLIGIILYCDDSGESCEIGYGIGSGYWQHGYATEAARRFLRYCFEEKKCGTVYASYFTGNEASRHVMEKCGMVYDHFAEKELTYLGVERDLTYYVIHREQYEALCQTAENHAAGEILDLVEPGMDYDAEIQAFRQEFLHYEGSMDGCGSLRRFDRTQDWIDQVESLKRPETAPPQWVPSTQFLFVRRRDRKVVGVIQIRHCFNEFLEKYAGHIGYSVCPSERRKGYATEMLRRCLPACKALGLDRVLVCCLQGNEGSRRTILRNGGVYETTVFEPKEGVYLERYWIDLSD